MFLELDHTKLNVYKFSQELTLACYLITKSFPQDEKFAMISQIRRASLSVHLNIAEGSSRKSDADRKRFFEIARGSIIEIDAALDIAVKLGYCKKEDLLLLGEAMVNCFKCLTGLIKAQIKK